MVRHCILVQSFGAFGENESRSSPIEATCIKFLTLKGTLCTQSFAITKTEKKITGFLVTDFKKGVIE